MSVPENAQQLISAANDFVQNGMAFSSNAGDEINRALESLVQTRLLATDSIVRAAGLLGEGHGGMNSITASALGVSSKVEEVENMLRVAVNTLLDLDQALITHSNTMAQVGHALLQGGS